MSYLFISHSSKNNFHAIAIQDWLLAHGWDELFLDLDPERGIVAGQRWEKALHDAASRCDAVLFLVSKAWLESDWCRKEFRLAHRLNKRIIGILIEDLAIDTLPDELTSTWQLVNLASGNDHQIMAAVHPDTGEEQHVHFSKAGLSRLKAGLVKAGLDPLFYQWPPENDPDRSPYRGMLPMEAEDAGIFFGREAPTNELLARLRGLRADPPPRFMVVLGASGAGKSSFLRAGVLPRLARDERNFITLPIIRPEHSVLWGDNGLLSSLCTSFKQHKVIINRAEVKKLIEQNPEQLIDLLIQLSEKAKPVQLPGETNNTAPSLILTIDQGEELFHSEGREQSQAFLKLLQKLATNKQLPLIILFTIRSDSYERLQTHKALDGISQQTFSLAPMPQGAYQAIIEGPAKRLKESDRELEIDPALTQQLLIDLEQAGSKDALPILAFTLERLYLDYGDDGDLRLDEYQDMGGLDGAIQKAVENALKNAELDPSLPNDRQAIEALLRRGLIPWLAGIDPDSQTPRRRVAKLKEIPTEARPIINHLIEQRLLATDVDKDQEITLEPAHETLLRQWGLLKGWLKEDLSTLTILEGIQRASRDWAANNQDKQYLTHSAGRLQDTEGLKQREDIAQFLTKNDWEYLKQCREQENQQRDKELAEAKKLAQAQKKVAKRTTIGMIAALVLTLIAGFMGWQSYKSEQLAKKNMEVAILEKEKAKSSINNVQEYLLFLNKDLMQILLSYVPVKDREKIFDKTILFTDALLDNEIFQTKDLRQLYLSRALIIFEQIRANPMKINSFLPTIINFKKTINKLIKKAPNDIQLQNILLNINIMHIGILIENGSYSKAKKLINSSIDKTNIQSKNDNNLTYEMHFVLLYASLSELYSSIGENEQGLNSIKMIRASFEKLDKSTYKDIPLYFLMKEAILLEKANYQYKLDLIGESLLSTNESIDNIDYYLGKHPNLSGLKLIRIDFKVLMSRIYNKQGDAKKAIKVLEKALLDISKLIDFDEGDYDYKKTKIFIRNTLGKIYWNNNYKKSIKMFEDNISYLNMLIKYYPNNTYINFTLAETHLLKGDVIIDFMGELDKPDGVKEYLYSLELLTKIYKKTFDFNTFKKLIDVANKLNSLSNKRYIPKENYSQIAITLFKEFLSEIDFGHDFNYIDKYYKTALDLTNKNREIIELCEKYFAQINIEFEYLKMNEKDIDVYVKNSKVTVTWSWVMLFTTDFNLVIKKLEDLLNNNSHDSKYELNLKGNLAHAYLLSDDYEAGKAIYSKFKGQKFPHGITWQEGTLQDFKALKAEGIDSPYFAKIAKEVFGVDGF